MPPLQPLALRMWKHHRLSQYRRLVFLILALNAAFLYTLVRQWGALEAVPLTTLANLVVVNIAAAILIRQQHAINLLFTLALSAPLSWPLWIRQRLGKVAHFGGVHSGGTVAGPLWFALVAYVLTRRFAGGSPGVSAATLGVTYALLALLVLVIVMALPPLRKRYHDAFELTHRFGGWAALVLFWLHTVLLIDAQRGDAALANALASSLGFWLLLLVTSSILYPWLRLRRVPVRLERPSDHAVIAHFDYGVTPAPGQTNAISLNPLREWHAFATIATPGEEGYRMIISRSGDWTGAFIDALPSHVWIKSVPPMGVNGVSQLFRRVVWVVTGSGIGPTMPLILATQEPVHLVWSARNHRATYGDALVGEILAKVPHALLWDTDERGRPDLVKLAFEAVRDFDAEAVVCISNQKLTRSVIYGLESRGTPAYGAIWDS